MTLEARDLQLSTAHLFRAKKAQLPTTGLGDGAEAWCSDGRKSGEGAGAGTGARVYFNTSDSTWRRYYDDSEVTT